MTEAEWDGCAGPGADVGVPGRKGERTQIPATGLRLLPAHLAPHDGPAEPRRRRRRRAVRGRAGEPRTLEAVQVAAEAARIAARADDNGYDYYWSIAAAAACGPGDAVAGAIEAALEAAKQDGANRAGGYVGAGIVGNVERRCQAALLRDVFGPLAFRRVALDPSWLAWNDGSVRKMSQAVHDDRAFDRLLLLADALEDSGCTDAGVLSHCRNGGEHVRGCWVVDLLLGKA